MELIKLTAVKSKETEGPYKGYIKTTLYNSIGDVEAIIPANLKQPRTGLKTYVINSFTYELKWSKVAVNSSTNYYANQLAPINTKSQYAPTFVINDADGYKTKHMNLNKESAAVLIEWLKENYVKK